MIELSPQQRQIVSATRNAAKLLLIGWFAAIAIVVAKLLSHSSTISVGGIDFPVRHAWVLVSVLTAAHLFVSYFLIQAIRNYLADDPDQEQRKAILDEIKAESNPFVHGLIPRVKASGPRGVWHRMQVSDPSAWVAYVASLVLVAALLPWSAAPGGLRWETGPGLWVFTGLAMILVEVNWLAGSAWIVWLSRIHVDDDRSTPARGAANNDSPSPLPVPFVVTLLFVTLGIAATLAVLPVLIVLSPLLLILGRYIRS
jgi:hypothetical protein